MATGSKREGDVKQAGAEKSAFSAPSISLPKGDGAIRGIGEKFAANSVTVTGSMVVPIATSPGRSGFGPPVNLRPQLSRSYDSGAAMGHLASVGTSRYPVSLAKRIRDCPSTATSKIRLILIWAKQVVF
jgi:hypothetical protein